MEKTHAIITYTGVHYLITPEQHEALKQLRLEGDIKIDNNTIKARNIADILTIQKYYETYPDKRPPLVDRYKNIQGMGMEGIVKNSHTKMLEQIAKGLRKHIGSKNYQGSDAPLTLLRMATTRMEVRENV